MREAEGGQRDAEKRELGGICRCSGILWVMPDLPGNQGGKI